MDIKIVHRWWQFYPILRVFLTNLHRFSAKVFMVVKNVTFYFVRCGVNIQKIARLRKRKTFCETWESFEICSGLTRLSSFTLENLFKESWSKFGLLWLSQEDSLIAQKTKHFFKKIKSVLTHPKIRRTSWQDDPVCPQKLTLRAQRDVHQGFLLQQRVKHRQDGRPMVVPLQTKLLLRAHGVQL